MTAAEKLLFTRIQRRVDGMTPEMASAILRSFQNIRDAMTEAEIVRAVQLGGAERLFQDVLTRAVLAVAYAPVKDTLRRNVVTSVRAYGRVISLPVPKQFTIAFDFLNPRVIDSIRTLETAVIDGLDTTVKETIRAIVENGLRDGVNPRAYARFLRESVGIGPTQLQEVENYRAALQGLEGRAVSSYTLRDPRFDRMAQAGEITPAQIEKAITTYTKRRIALNANTTARTTAATAQKTAQRMSWQDAIDKGFVDGRLMKTWLHLAGQTNPRAHHEAMHGQTVPFDEVYSNGDMIAGEGDPWNCHCIDQISVARA